MPDETDPPRKVYGFKERAFKRDNVATPDEPPPPTVKELAMMSGGPGPGPAQRMAPGTGKPDDPNDVHAALQRNRQAAHHHGADEIEIKKIKSRRKRDFWLLLIGGNLVIVGSVFVSGFNIVSVVFGGAGVIMFTLAVTWVMWQVMSKY